MEIESDEEELGYTIPSLLAPKIIESSRRKSRPVKSQYCGHCHQSLNIKSYKKHRRLYYSNLDGSWLQNEAASRKDKSLYDCVASSSVGIIPELPTFTDNELIDHDTMTFDEDCDDTSSNNSTDSDHSELDSEEMWEEDDITYSDDEIDVPELPKFQNDSPEFKSAQALVLWLVGFLIVLQAKFFIPNAALDICIKFMYTFICVLGHYSPVLNVMSRLFPKSLYLLHKMFHLNIEFKRYVVCPKCNEIYARENTINTVGSLQLSKHCSLIKYPNHLYLSRRAPCHALLLKTVQFTSGRKILYPFKVYCYKTFRSTLQEFLLRPKFYSDCQLWRDKTSIYALSSVYDGKIWKEFQQVQGSPFLSAPYNFALMLNVDWFQPYSHTIYSVGVIYLAIINLPRNIRYKRENVIIVGIIPGPSEPNHDMNSFLKPLVDELLTFWTGIKLRINTGFAAGIVEKDVRCALLCVACDLPAGRKCCGFLSHNACLGCSRCLKRFKGTVSNMNFSGFDRSQWPPRTDANHRRNIKKVIMCKTKTDQTKTESSLGCRYSAFLDLPYFDAPRFLVIDPMHNLFLGTGKRMIKLWISEGLLEKGHFEKIQKFVDSMTVPSDIGRIPRKIESGFVGFKADQFKSWINIFSIPALYGILSNEHFECWRHFVLACRILCKHNLTDNDVTLADILLMQFCRRVERIHGEMAITPNMHMHGHLKDVVMDYGPIQEFWCFSFERYNGILGNQPSNNRSIEPQLLHRFLADCFANSFQFPSEYKEDFEPLLASDRFVGSVLDTLIEEGRITLPTKSSRGVFDSHELSFLKELYEIINPGACDMVLNSIYTKYSSLTIKGRTYGSSGKRTHHPYVVLASWDKSSLFGAPPTRLPDHGNPSANERPVNIHYYLKATFCDANNITCSQSLILSRVSWFFPHPERNAMGKPAQLWCNNFYEPVGVSSFLPLDHLLCRCAHANKLHKEELLLVIVPLIE